MSASNTTPRIRRRPTDPAYLDHLAEQLQTDLGPGAMLCHELRDTMYYAVEINDRGVSEAMLRRAAKCYATRLSALGPEEFDRRALLGG